jgi:hypothetical protein
MNKLFLFLNTIKFLKFQQIRYRFYYLFRKKIRSVWTYKYPSVRGVSYYPLELQQSIKAPTSYLEKEHFSFLNLEKKFERGMDWNYNAYGKLWTYNLSYFDFLQQKEEHDFVPLIEDFINQKKILKDAIEPFPISLRGLNWIKYLTFKKIKNQKISDSLYTQYQELLDNIEYHLLGNHLLENGFSLLFAGYYFRDDEFYKKAKEILKIQLEEQILTDGGHFELSPMYHQLMLFRVLDGINLIQNNPWKDYELLLFFKEKASLMLSWLKEISYENGSIPLLNDSANKIAPTSNELIMYALRLDVDIQAIKLGASGYRKIRKEFYELILDVGAVGADYIPGHAHSDTFNFELSVQGKPFIVDTGISTYENNEQRIIERSTLSHNTVEIEGLEQSEVWGAFRVGNRAKVIYLEESESSIKAMHDGYKKINSFHQREWRCTTEKIIIKDVLSRRCKAKARLHFHPNITLLEIKKQVYCSSGQPNFGTYFYASEFNKREKALFLEIDFDKENEFKIYI